ncbi:hypothetical protein AAFF_G00211660 [Aldrovandia affinis]|uniref:Apolipoprotein D n=1 Tax=Aldrovandia affinis TaxID=143900 RepID=A0AAD7SWU3_9TELE|nr:hypothetical protein AAFF_G00211660 [Aldrovandia affinis]
MYLLSAAAVLSLLSVSTAIAQQCEDLIQPLVLDNVSPLLGKWIFLVGSSDYQRYAAMLKMLNSSWMDIVMSSHNDTVVINQATM